MASVPFSYTDCPSTTGSSINSSPYADIVESPSNAHLITDSDSDKDSRSGINFQGRDSSSSSSIHKLALVSLVISLLCIGFILVGMAWWVFALNDGQLLSRASAGRGKEERQEVCLPCVQIGPNPLDSAESSASGAPLWRDQLDVRYDDDDDDVDNATEMCCASTAAQFAALFKLILQRQQAVKELADSLDRGAEKDVTGDQKDTSGEVSMLGASSVSAHLVLKPQKTQKSELTAEPKEQQWKSPAESPMSHVRQGLRFRNKRLVVHSPGLYYVYCQLLYSPPQTSSSDAGNARPDVASAYVRRYSILRPAAPEFLLKSRHTRHDVRQDRHSAYVGGVFRLHRGDSLYVQVSRPELISHDDVGSFFGLFKIGD